MQAFYDLIIQPFLNLVEPRRMLEIGSGHGQLTRSLLEYCQGNESIAPRLTVIDTKYLYDINQVKRFYRGLVQFYESSSLQVLPSLSESFDMVFLDGDHNWYNVFHELTHLHALVRRQQTPFPIVFVNQVSWPYGRRDTYAAPEAVPSVFRKPYRRKGMTVGAKALAQHGGLFRNNNNAELPFGEKNGVLTAVEDFVKTAPEQMKFIKLDGYHGLGILISNEWFNQYPKLSQLVDQLKLSPVLARYIQNLERDRLKLQAALEEEQDRARTLEAENLLNSANSLLKRPAEFDIVLH